jgi:succinoglycan biosynthesis protein ExoM
MTSVDAPRTVAAKAAEGDAKLCVAVCTYKRPAMLHRALSAICQSVRRVRESVVVLVVDNDGSDPAVLGSVDAVARASHARIEYAVERRPGIAAAREAVFRIAAQNGATWLAMIDDDEVPSEDWLAELLAEQARSGAVVVGGPVRPVFPQSTRAMERHARFWSVERQVVDGRTYVYAAGNFLVDLRAIEAEPRPLFDESFGLSGGEDVVFFSRLFDRGFFMSWAESAVVYEEVPIERASIQWMRMRRFGVGHMAVRSERVRGGRAPLAKTLALTARLAIYPWLGREPGSRWLGWLLELSKVRGRYAAHAGLAYQQYRRE